ncbi:MAG: MSMEG_1061 family FMN-dependent PPOX-type flavoprotein [Pseudomonadota bacterium]
MSTITSVAQMRAAVGDAHPALAKKNRPFIDDFARAFIAASPFIVMSTSDAEGRQDASPKGDAPGFVEVVDETTLLIPDRPGNKLAYGHQNILANPHIGILFVIPQTPETLRINGRAELSSDPALLEQLAARGKPAILAIRVTVKECFFHCGKAMIRSNLWQPDKWGERHEVSFGKMFATRENADESTAKAYDQAIAKDYDENL